MHANYRFRIQRMGSKRTPRYQLRVGMDGEKGLEFIPLHRSAFAKRLPLAILHSSPVDAHVELSALLHWLDVREAEPA